MKIYRLSAEYCVPPIFNTDVDEMGPIAIAELNLSASLRDELEKWDLEFQQTFSDDYPPDSGFQSEDDQHRHNQRGAELAVLLQKELGPDVTVEFFPLESCVSR